MYVKEYPDIKLELPAKGLAPKLTAATGCACADDEGLSNWRWRPSRRAEKFYADAAEQSESQSGRRLLNYLSGMERGPLLPAEGRIRPDEPSSTGSRATRSSRRNISDR